MTRLLFLLTLFAVAYWARRPQSRTAGGQGASGQRKNSGMTRSEALAVLGLQSDATSEEIAQAYKHLIQQVHPDRPGGSAYLAQQLNQARRTLLHRG